MFAIGLSGRHEGHKTNRLNQKSQHTIHPYIPTYHSPGIETSIRIHFPYINKGVEHNIGLSITFHSIPKGGQMEIQITSLHIDVYKSIIIPDTPPT